MEAEVTELPDQTPNIRRWPVYFSYLAAYGMVICFATIFIQFLLWIAPGLDSRGMLIVCGLASLEAFISFWLVTHLPTAQKQLAFYRVTELGIILIVLKLFTELRAGPVSFWNNVSLWPVEFPFNVLTGNYILTVLPVLASWQISNLLAADLSLLGADEASTPDERIKTTPLRVLILRRFLGLGMAVVILACIPPQTVIPTPLPVAPNAVPAVVAYFVLGLILVSLTRYVNLETTWWQARLQVPVQIPRRWFAYSALVLAVLVVVTGWLPTNYDMGLLATFKAVLLFINQFILTLYGLILLLFSLIAQLIGKQPTVTRQEQIPTPPPIPPSAATASAINWNLVKSIFLWGSLIILAIVALRQYIAFNQEISQELKRFRPIRWLITAWERFKATLKKVNKTVGKFIQDSLDRLRRDRMEPDKTGEWDFINPRRLSPRQKVIFYYLALVRRAREAGIPRQDGQTPYEYAHSLKSRLKEENEGVDAMTESFIEARYSRHDIPAKQARRAESIWVTIRQVLRNARRSPQEDKTKLD
jgi:hypothetical protein